MESLHTSVRSRKSSNDDRYRSPPSRSSSKYRSRSRSRTRSRSRSRGRVYRRSAFSGRDSYGGGGGRNSYNTPRDHPKPSKCVGVFGLSFDTYESELRRCFSKFGDIEDIKLVYDNYTGKSRGFAFVYYRHLADAKSAKDESQGMKIDGRYVRVDYSVTQRPHTPTPGVYMGRTTSRRSSRYDRSYSRSRSRTRSRSYERR